MNPRKAFLTVKQISLLTGTLSAISAAGIAFGLLTPEKWAAISGAAIAVVTFAGSFWESTTHDDNVGEIQSNLNDALSFTVVVDQKPGPLTVGANQDVIDIANEKTKP